MYQGATGKGGKGGAQITVLTSWEAWGGDLAR